MRFKNAFAVMIDNFGLTFKLLLFHLVTGILFAGLSYTILTINLSEIVESDEGGKLFGLIGEFFSALTSGNTAYLQTFHDTFLSAFGDFVTMLSGMVAPIVWSVVGIILLYLCTRFLNGLASYTVGHAVNNRMATDGTTKLSTTLFSHLGTASLYQLIYVLVSFLYTAISVVIVWFVFFYALSFLPLIFTLALAFASIAMLWALKFTLISDWMPLIITEKYPVCKAMRASFSAKKNFGRRFANYLMFVFVVVIVNVVGALCTFGSVLVISIPLSYLFVLSLQFVNLYEERGRKYFVGGNNIVNSGENPMAYCALMCQKSESKVGSADQEVVKLYQKNYQAWLDDPRLCAEAREELLAIASNEKEKEYRFGGELAFGTAGMRGIIGYGMNMMNVYTVMRATQGLSQYILTLSKEEREKGVVISYDTRRNSRLFAEVSAGVLAKNGIKAYLFDDVHPVPMLSYAVRYLGTIAGIMITASHNPKEYNGYKVYGADGAQMSPEATEIVVGFIDKITDYLSVSAEKDSPLVLPVPKEVDETYIDELSKLTLSKEAVEKCGKDLKLVYTPVHGSGYVPVMKILKRLGINVTVVEEQTTKDTEFSTVAVPNPEYKETLSMGISLANQIDADVVFGTDPDSDRLGVAIKDKKGEFIALSGNQVGILLLDYILTRLKEENALPANSAVVKSFVSTGMAKAICDEFGVALYETPVGFKFIGEKIKQWEADGKHVYVFGFEESCGYLRGIHARDKDAVVASMLCAEMVCYYTYLGKTVYDRLQEIYKKYGYVLDLNISTQYSGLNAMKEMNAVVNGLKQEKVEKIGPFAVEAVRDYSASVRKTADGKVETLDIPKCNCVYYELAGGSFICVRPSGTEPKLKVYYSVRAKDEMQADQLLVQAKSAVAELLEKVKQA